MNRLLIAFGVLLALSVLAFSAATPDKGNSQAAAQQQSAGMVTPPTVVDPTAAKVQLDIASAGPRQVEDTTSRAIVRDYGRAWRDLNQALEQNRADILSGSFVGIARDRLAAEVAAQSKVGFRTRYIDRGHKVQAVFYSPEGSAMQLRDVAQYEIDLLDGGDVVAKQNVTVNYLALMTVAEDRWKVRVLEAVPSF